MKTVSILLKSNGWNQLIAEIRKIYFPNKIFITSGTAARAVGATVKEENYFPPGWRGFQVCHRLYFSSEAKHTFFCMQFSEFISECEVKPVNRLDVARDQYYRKGEQEW